MSISKAEAIAAFGGNAAALARFLGISQQAVSAWEDESIPELRELQLRMRMPDVFGAVQGESPPAHRSRAGWEEGRPSNESLVDDPVAAAPAAKVA